MPVIQDLPAALETRSQHGMILPDGPVTHQHQPHFILRKTCLSQRDIFRDRIVFAIAFGGRKGSKRRAPAVGFTVLGKIAEVVDRRIDRTIGIVQLRAAGP